MTASVQAIYRYPLKGFTPEPLARVALEPGRTLPFDRAFAIENGPSGFDPQTPRYLPKVHFLMLMRNEEVAKVAARFDETTRELVFHEGGEEQARGSVDTPEGREAIEAYMARRFAADLRGPPRFLVASGHSFSDVAAKVLHMVNLASLRELESALGAAVDPLRFRPNLVIDGFAPFSELDMVGTVIRIGGIRGRIVKRTQRCAATNVDPARGVRDLQVPKGLMSHYGHTDFGVYVEVIERGAVAVGDGVAVEQAELAL